jgi:hypothetical protein
MRTPLLGYDAPHLSARGTLTLLNNALLSAHFRFADPPAIHKRYGALAEVFFSVCSRAGHLTAAVFITPTADKKKVLKPTCLGSR